MLKDTLKELRQGVNRSQTDMAATLHITRQAYNHYETGGRAPTPDGLILLANYFDVSVDYLLGRTGQKKPAPDKGDELLELLRSDPRKLALAELVFSLDDAGLDKLEKLVDIVQS